MLTALPPRSPEELDRVTSRIRQGYGSDISAVTVEADGTIIKLDQPQKRKQLLPGLQRTADSLKRIAERVLRARSNRETFIERQYARIAAVVPALESEGEVYLTVESLLTQSRPIDLIVVIINGPGESQAAYESLLWLAAEFPDTLKVERPSPLNGRHADGSSRGSKVGALNYAYQRYLHDPASTFDFMLGVDADIEADPEMVHHLEVDLIQRVKAAGVMARYSFKTPEDAKGKSMSLAYSQRHEFAVTVIKQQLRGYTSDILGGQATLFRVDALRRAARETNGGCPWDSRSLVEDAELTRTFQKLGYINATSAKARAWTGLMFTPNAWQKQRRKWQDGHLTDMMRDFHPIMDARRWFDQFVMGWNLVLRVLFAVTLAASIALDQMAFHLIWLAPIGLAVLQSFLVACKIPDRTLREIIRSIMFVPGEIYYVRTLSVWLDSILIAIANVRRDGWGNQAKAEASTRKKGALSGWILILMAVAVPMGGLLSAAHFLPYDMMHAIIIYLWHTITVLTAGSTIGMLVFVLRMMRHYRNLAP